MEKKGLRVNAKKAKVMVCSEDLNILSKSGKYPCRVCYTGVRNSSIYCDGCKMWVHKKCSSLRRLVADPNFRCAHCLGTARAIDARPMETIKVDDDELEVVDSFCYLGDMLSAAGGCDQVTTTRVKSAWKKFRELMLVLTTHHFLPKTHGRIYSICVCSALLHASETWPLTKPSLLHLQRNDRAMIRQLCHVKPDEVFKVRSHDLLEKIGLQDQDWPSVERALTRWYGHVEWSNGAIKSTCDLSLEGRCGSGRPKMSWQELTERDRKQWKLLSLNPQDRKAWRSGIRLAMKSAVSKSCWWQFTQVDNADTAL